MHVFTACFYCLFCSAKGQDFWDLKKYASENHLGQKDNEKQKSVVAQTSK